MAVSLNSGDLSRSNATGASGTASRPTNNATDDVLYAFVAVSGSNGNGIGIEDDSVNGAWTPLIDARDSALGNISFAVLRLVCDDGVADASWKVASSTLTAGVPDDWGSSFQHNIRVMRASGADTTTPEDVAVDVNTPAGTSASYSANALTTVNDNAVVLYGAVHDRRGHATVPDTTLFNDAPDDSGDVGHSVGYKTQVTAGSTGTGAFTTLIGDQYVTFTIAIREASGGGAVDVTVDVPSQAISFTAQTPLALADKVVNVPSQAIAYTAQTPRVFRDVVVDIPSQGVSFTAQAPTAAAASIISVPNAELAFVAVAPEVFADAVINAPSSPITFTGQPPAIIADRVISLAAANISFTGQAPDVGVLSGTVIQVPTGTFAFNPSLLTVAQNALINVPSDSVTFIARVPTARSGDLELASGLYPIHNIVQIVTTTQG